MASPTTRLRLHVSPGASRSEIVGIRGGSWHVRVTAAPERGRANDAVLRLLEERRRVLEAIENLHHENPGSLSEETEELSFQDNHLGDVATVTFDREMASTLEQNSTHVLASIDAALARLEQGTYGTRETCGGHIA